MANLLVLIWSADTPSAAALSASVGPSTSSNRADICAETSPSSAFVSGGSMDAAAFTVSARARTSSRKEVQRETAGMSLLFKVALGILTVY
jgi:hypothetical protein